MDYKTESIRSFGRCAKGISNTYFPCSRDQIREVFAAAAGAPQRRVTIRGGGHSFDGQALHEKDDGSQIVVCTRDFEPDRIEFDVDGHDTVRLGAGVTWRAFVDASLSRARHEAEPVRLPGSIQTGRGATVGGTVSGNTLSRFSGTVGKESQWVESLRIITPDGGEHDVSREHNPDLFRAVVGGHGYIGFVTDVTYRLIRFHPNSSAHTMITRHESFRSLIDEQLRFVRRHVRKRSAEPLAVSSAWFRGAKIKGGVFVSHFAAPNVPPRPGFPIYGDIESEGRYWIELMVRIPLLNLAIHEILYRIAGENGGRFENDLRDFLFFMDGNTVAKERFEQATKQQFPIVQQTFVVPIDRAEAFAKTCEHQMQLRNIQPTECDMLFVRQDDSLMSANYQLDGFAITLGFEPIAPKGCPAPKIPRLLSELSERCADIGGRIHLVKNVHAHHETFRAMFSPQIELFEEIKRKYDPKLLLQNPFSDRFFQFAGRKRRYARRVAKARR